MLCCLYTELINSNNKYRGLLKEFPTTGKFPSLTGLEGPSVQTPSLLMGFTSPLLRFLFQKAHATTPISLIIEMASKASGIGKFQMKVGGAFISNRCLDVSGLNLDSRRLPSQCLLYTELEAPSRPVHVLGRKEDKPSRHPRLAYPTIVIGK